MAAPGSIFTLEGQGLPQDALPDEEVGPGVGAQAIYDELMGDGNPRLNLATFVTTWMDPHAEVLMAKAFDKNMIDKDEYPQTAEIERRCVNMVAHLFNAPADGDGVGASTTGSSEAVMLAGFSDKKTGGGAPAGGRARTTPPQPNT